MDHTDPGYRIFEHVFERAEMTRVLAATSSPLRVLPNSHRDGVLTDEQIERLARTVPPVDCVAKAGGVVAMRPLTVHASSKSVDDKPRRVLHIEYADSLRLSSGIELAKA